MRHPNIYMEATARPLRQQMPRPRLVAFLGVLLVTTLCAASVGLGAGSKTFLSYAAVAAPLKIMPMGDSLTAGWISPPAGHHSYRGYLYNKLTMNGYSIDFVGSQSLTPHGGGDPDHEGHSGFTIGPDPSACGFVAGNFSDNLSAYLSPTVTPDALLLMIGINDVGCGGTFAMTATTRLENLVTNIKTLKPSMKILLASILPFRDSASGSSQINAINTKAQQLGNASASDTVYFVDMFNQAGLVNADYDDGVHLSESGARKVADVWYNAIVNSIFAPTPTPSPTACASPNLIQNGDFSTGNLNNWSSFSPSDIAVVNGAARMTRNGNIYQVLNTIPGLNYTVSAWVKLNQQITAPAGGGGLVILTHALPAFTFIRSSAYYNASNTTPGVWSSVVYTFTATTNQTQFTFRNLGFDGVSHGEFNADADQFIVTPCPNPSNPPPSSGPTATPTPTPACPSIIQNGNFASGNLSPWGPIALSDFSVINGSAHMSTTGTIVQSFSATVGARYYGSGWLRINNQIAAPTDGGLVAIVNDANFVFVASSPFHNTSFVPTGTWTKFTFVFTPTTATNYMYLRNASFAGQPDGQFDADFDNIIVTTCENVANPKPGSLSIYIPIVSR
jgi:lysophospholipase L1-like esterase